MLLLCNVDADAANAVAVYAAAVNTDAVCLVYMVVAVFVAYAVYADDACVVVHMCCCMQLCCCSHVLLYAVVNSAVAT